MLKCTLICLLVGFAAATAPAHHSAWKTNTQYRYRLNARSLTGLHDVADQYSGFLIQAELVLQQRPNGVLSAKLEEPRYAEVHAHLPGGWDSEVPEHLVTFEDMALSDSPFDISLKNGVVDRVLVRNDVPGWEANIYKSVLSQIQVDLQGQNLIDSHHNQLPEEKEISANYKTMEDTVTGKCETEYNVFELPENVLQNRPQIAPQPHLRGNGKMIGIVKTKNYSHCDQNTNYHSGFDSLKSGRFVSNNYEKIISRSAVSMVVVSGDRKKFTIQSSQTTDKIIVTPNMFGAQKGMVASRVNITLIDVTESHDEWEQVEHPICVGNLVYNFNKAFAPNNHASAGRSNNFQPQRSVHDEANSSEERRQQEEVAQHNQQKRSRRGADNKVEKEWGRQGHRSSSSERVADDLYNNEQYRPQPSLEEAPELPLLPNFIGYKGQSIKSAFAVIPAVKKVVQQLAREIQDPSRIPQGTLAKFTILTDIMRIMNSKEMAEVSRQLYLQHKSGHDASDTLEWKMWRDAMAQVGTGPALLSIIEWTRSQKIQGEEAAQVISSLVQSVINPTQAYLNALYDFVTSQQVQQQAYLNETSLIAMGDLTHQSLVDYHGHKARYPVNVYHSFGTQHMKYQFMIKKVIPYLSQGLHAAAKRNDSIQTQVYIRALGQVGHPLILNAYKRYLEGDSYMSVFNRFVIVTSMDQLVRIYPKEARSVLYKIYVNTGDAPQVRVAAVFQLLRTSPPADMLKRMAEYTHVEPSLQVRSAVKSAIESASKLTYPSYQYLAENARAAIKMLNPETLGLKYAQDYLHNYVAKEMNFGYKLFEQYITGEDSFIPNYVYHSLRLSEGGFSRQHSAIVAMVSSVRNLMIIAQDKFSTEKPMQVKQSPWADKVAKLLNIKMDQPDKLEANVFLKVLGGKRFFAFDQHSVDHLPKIIQSLAATIDNGPEFNYTKTYTDGGCTISFPTEMGFPFVYSEQTPYLINIGGKSKMDRSENKFEKVYLEIESTVTGAARQQLNFGFIVPHKSKHYLSGYDKNFQVTVPLQTKIHIDVKKNLIEADFAPYKPDQSENVMHYSTWPYTSAINILEIRPVSEQSETRTIHIRSPQAFEQSYGKHETGLVFRLSGSHEYKYMDAHWAYAQAKKHDFVTALLAPWYATSIQHSIINLDYIAEESESRNVHVSMSYKQISQKNSHQDIEESSSSEQESDDPANLAETVKSTPEHRQKQILNQASAKISKPYGLAVDFVLNIGNEKRASPRASGAAYVATFSSVKSSVDNKQRQLFIFSKKSYFAQNEFQICIAATTKASQSPRLNFIEALKAPAYHKTYVQVRYGDSCQSGAQVNIQVELEKSEERKQALQAANIAQSCVKEMENKNYQLPACANLTIQAQAMDQYKINTHIEKVGLEAQNTTMKIYNYLRYFGFTYLEENYVNASGSESPNHVNITINLEPKEMDSANVRISAYQYNANFTNIRLNSWAKSVVVVRPESNPLRNLKALAYQQVESDSSCVLDHNSATTFNNRSYPAALGNCYHVLVHHAYTRKQYEQHASLQRDMAFTILARDSVDSNNLKELKFIVGTPNQYKEFDVIGRVPRPRNDAIQERDSIRVLIDGKPVTIPNGRPYVVKGIESEVLARIYQRENLEIKIELESGPRVYFDGQRAKVILPDQYKGHVRGLCGTNSGEAWNDFMSPQNCLLQDHRNFAASYAIADNSCYGPAKDQHRRAKSAPCAKRVNTYSNVVSDHDAHNHHHKDDDGPCGTKHQTRYVVEKNGNTVCFTTKPVPSCHKGCQSGKTIEKEVPVHCVKSSSAVNLYRKNIDKGASPDFSGKPVTKTIKISVPNSCQ